MEIFGYLEFTGSVVLLMWITLRGFDIMLAALLSSLFVIITNTIHCLMALRVRH